MQIMEFYNPDNDKMGVVKPTDTRKKRLTLREIKKMRRIRELKRAEEDEHDKFVSVMYAPQPQG